MVSILNILVGMFIAFVFFGKRTRRMGVNFNTLTFPEFFGRRFDSNLFSTLVRINFCAMPICISSSYWMCRFMESPLLTLMLLF